MLKNKYALYRITFTGFIIFVFTLFFLYIFCCKNKNLNKTQSPEEASQSNMVEHTTNRTILLPPDNGQIYIGAFPDFGGSEDKVSKDKIIEFEKIIGKPIGWAYFSLNWYNIHKFKLNTLKIFETTNTTPFIRLLPRSKPEEYKLEKKYSLDAIISGKLDNDLKYLAQVFKAYAKPILFDFAVEPNGNWFNWSGAYNGADTKDKYGDPTLPDGPEKWKDAYVHIIELFKREGVNNLTYFFHINAESIPKAEWNSPKYYYPGDKYIDWIGISAYGPLTPKDDWQTLESILSKTASQIREIPSSKPIALLEFGVTNFHLKGNKSTWLKNAFTTILQNKYIQLKAIAYWHENWEEQDGLFATLRLDSSQQVFETAQQLFANPKFTYKLNFLQPKQKIKIPSQTLKITKFNWTSYLKYKLSKAKNWYWQLTGKLDIYKNADIYDIDPYEYGKQTIYNLLAQNKFVICYIDVGTAEKWRKDFKNFPKDVIGKQMEDWEDEYWLNIRKYPKFAKIIINRLKYAKSLGCQAIEGDNVDGYDNDTGFNLNRQDSINYIKWLAQQTHNLGMLYGLKNSPDIVKNVVAYVDFAVVEECQKYNECSAYVPLTQQHKQVLAVEYDVPKTNRTKVSTKFKQLGFLGGFACYDLNGCFDWVK